MDDVLRSTRNIGASAVGKGLADTSGLPVITAALALGRVTDLAGKDDAIWLRLCQEARTIFAKRSEDPAPDLNGDHDECISKPGSRHSRTKLQGIKWLLSMNGEPDWSRAMTVARSVGTVDGRGGSRPSRP